jgi:hypothetical protein
LVLDVAGLRQKDYPDMGNGRKLLEKQLITAHICILEDL